MSNTKGNHSQEETTCGSLLYELQIIWNEVGEPDVERDRMLFELEQECLEVYRRKVDQANKCRAQLRQAIADAEAELAVTCAALGERPVHIRQPDQLTGSLREELNVILPELDEMRKRKCERRKQFLQVLGEIQKVASELYQASERTSSMPVDETDLSLRKLEEVHRQLETLQKEKSERLKQVLDLQHTMNSLCLVLGMDFEQSVSEVHPSLGNTEGPKSISKDTIERLMGATKRLREIKIQRMQRLQDLATSMLQLWDLMDTPVEEQQMFQNVTCNVAASEHEITEPNTLSVDFINCIESEVCRLEELKASKMKELVLKKNTELEEICRKTHMVVDTDSTLEYAIEAIESGTVDPAYILEQIELQTSKIKEEAFARKEILEKVEKWIAACEEESWLEEYNRDENRYNAGRGAHLTLKRAEKARSLVTKLPAMVEALSSKVKSWEKERDMEFTYDGISLLSMLEEYTIFRQEKEEERRRQRDQKKLQGQLIAEQEALFGSKPSPSKPQSVKKNPRVSTGGGGAINRRLSLGGTVHQTPRSDAHHAVKATPNSRSTRRNDRSHQNDQFHDSDFAAPLTGARRGLEVTGTLLKNHSFGSAHARDIQSPVSRVPFSPISSSASSKANNSLEDANKMMPPETLQTLQKTIMNSTPQKDVTSVLDEENRTPRTMPIPVPSTPSTVSIPMQTAVTPALPPATFGSNATEEVIEEIEYSFEERRAGFVLPKTVIKSVIQV